MSKSYTQSVFNIKGLFNTEANVFPWVYALAVAVLMAFYLGASSYFEENVNGIQVRTSRSRLAANNPDLRSLYLYEDRAEFYFDWRSYLVYYGKNGAKRRMLPADYSVNQGAVSLRFHDNISLTFHDSDDVLTIQTDIPDGGSIALPWKINKKYTLLQEDPRFSYLCEPGNPEPVFEILSAEGHAQISEDKIFFKAQDTLTLRPYGGGRASFEEWLAKEKDIPLQNSAYQQLRTNYYDALLAEISGKITEGEKISQEDQASVLALALASGKLELYREYIDKFTKQRISDFRIAGFAGNIAAALPSYLSHVQKLRTRISKAIIEKDRDIFSETDLSAFLIARRLTRAYEILLKLTAEKIDSVPVYTLVDQLLFLTESQKIHSTKAKKELIIKHLDAILPNIVFLYQGLYLADGDPEAETFSQFPAIKLASALLMLSEIGFTEGPYKDHYQRIGFRLLETVLNSFSSQGRIPATLTFDGNLSYSKESLDLQVLPFMIHPQYRMREHSASITSSDKRYVLSAADQVKIVNSSSAEFAFNIKWPAQIPQYFAVFGLTAVNKVSVNQSVLSPAQTSRLGDNEWYFVKNSNVLLVSLNKNTGDLNISVDLSVSTPQKPAPSADASAPAGPKPSEEEKKEEEQSKEDVKKEKEKEEQKKKLTPEEKKKLEKQRKAEEKEKEEQPKKDEEKRKQEEKKKKKQEEDKK